MKKSKLISLLETLNKKELRAFSLFVSSPYFNKYEENILLTNFLVNCAPSFNEEKISKEAVYDVLFPDQKFDEKNLSYIMSGVTKLLEKFFQIRMFEAKKFQQEKFSLQTLIDKKQLKIYEREYEKVSNNLKKVKKQNNEYFLNSFQLAEISIEHFNLLQIRKHNIALQDASNFLDKFYLSTKLKYLCTMLNDQKMIASEYQLTLKEEISNYLSQNSNNLDPNIELFYLTFQMLEKEDDSNRFELLRQFLQSKTEHFTVSDATFVYFSSINYCIRKIRKGERKYAEEALKLYIEAIDTETLYENGKLSQWVYKNIIDLALGLKQYDWIEEFIYEYNDRLDEKFQQNALYYNLANLFWHQKNYSKAMVMLNQTQFTEIYYSFGAKEMLIKIYYELDEIDPLTSLLASFTLFLKRNKSVSKNIKVNYLNFCSFMNKILRLKPHKKEALVGELKQSKFLTGRSWLIEKTLEKKV